MLLQASSGPRLSLATRHREGNSNQERCQQRNRKLHSPSSLAACSNWFYLCLRGSYTLFNVFNSLQITSKFSCSCSFMGHFNLVIFFHVPCKQEENIQRNILLRNKLMAQFGVNFTAQWSERDLAGCPRAPRRRVTAGA